MKNIMEFYQAAFLVCILSAISLIMTDNVSTYMFLAGMLLVFYSIRSLMEENKIAIVIIQFIISSVFAVQSGLWASFLVFYEIKYSNKKKIQLFMPMLVYVIAGVFVFRNKFPIILLNMIFILFLSIALYFVDLIIKRYLITQKQISHAMSVTALNELYEKKLNHELVVKNYLSDRNARLEERENISRSIHNSVGHSITAAIMTLDAADMLFDSSPERAREKVQAANERIHTSLDSIRRAVRVLDNENEHILMKDFIGEINAVIEDFVVDTSICVYFDNSGIDMDIPIQHEHTEFLTGAVQELFSNGVKHGKADRFTVSIQADSKHIMLGVSDNGTSDFCESNSTERIQNGFGLKKLASYAVKCGGKFSYVNENGFSVQIVLPLYEKKEESYE